VKFEAESGEEVLRDGGVTDMKMTDQCAGCEITGRENDGPICTA